MKRFFSLLRKENGAIGMEYAVLVAAMACAVTWGGTCLGKGVYKHFASAGTQLHGAVQPAGLPGVPGGGSSGGTGGSANGGTGDGSAPGGTVNNGDDDADGGDSSLGEPGDTGENSPDVNLGNTGESQVGRASGG